MATERTDVVIVGMGAVGGIMAAELGKAGMRVIGLERGPRLTTADFTPHDELRYFQRQDLRPSAKRQPEDRSFLRPGENCPDSVGSGSDTRHKHSSIPFIVG